MCHISHLLEETLREQSADRESSVDDGDVEKLGHRSSTLSPTKERIFKVFFRFTACFFFQFSFDDQERERNRKRIAAVADNVILISLRMGLK